MVRAPDAHDMVSCGQQDFAACRDFEDIVAVVASRPSIVDDVTAASPLVRTFLAERFRRCLALPEAREYLLGALASAYDPAEAVRRTGARMQAMAVERRGIPTPPPPTPALRPHPRGARSPE